MQLDVPESVSRPARSARVHPHCVSLARTGATTLHPGALCTTLYRRPPNRTWLTGSQRGAQRVLRAFTLTARSQSLIGSHTV
jgi:hypothetical protein